MTERITDVQRDVLDRLSDGWTLHGLWSGSFQLSKPGEPSRHVAAATVLSLIGRRLISSKGAGLWGRA